MTFKKLALAAAIAAVPVAGFSAESLEDSALGGVTGQDGIEVAIDIGAAGIVTDIYLHDTDGLDLGVGYASYSYDGALVIDNMDVGVGGASIVLEIDAGDRQAAAGAGSAPILNINVSLPATLTINTGAISVANSGIDEGNRNVTGQTAALVNSMEIELGSTQLNIQLGNEEQTGALAGTDMVVLSAVVNNGITINNLAVNDINSGGTIGAASVSMVNANGDGNLDVAVDVNVTTAGLVIGVGTLGNTGMNIEIVDQYLGTTTAGIIGDVSVRGLQMTGTTVTISGK